VGYIYSNVKQLKSYVKKIETFLSDMKTSEAVEDKKTTSRERYQADKIRPLLPDIRSLIDDTILGSQMVKTLVHSLRTFSHLDQAEWKKSDIHEGIDTCLMILNPELKNRIRVHKDYGSTGVIECNIGQLNQVFLNLLSNAAQAIEGSGNIWIRTKDDDGSVVVEIKDDGSGISQDIQPKIFDPFFSTKDVGKGIGLGLSISYSIVKNHNGTIEVQSGDGEGSLFTVILPMKR
jgi:two-component system NtrC family sensor kinase